MPTKYFFMKKYLPIFFLYLVLISGFTVGTVCGAPTFDSVKDNVLEKISGTNIIWYDYSDSVLAIKQQPTKSSCEKLSEMSTLFGMDVKLANYLHTNDAESNDILNDAGNRNIITDIISGIESLFEKDEGKTIDEGAYTDEEGRQAWSQYMANYILNYEATGAFGGPIE